MPNGPSSGRPHPQSYDTSIAGVAIDRVTGLMWQRDAYAVSTATTASADTVLPAATAYCASLSLGEFQDWRVPSRIELVSLMDLTVPAGQDASVFSGPTGQYLTSSVHGLGTNSARVAVVDAQVADLGFGTQFPSSTIVDPLQGPDYVRCVRGHGTASGPHYAVANGTVRDNWTGLTWIQSASSSTMEPSAIGAYCAAQTNAGGGWREPSVNELETLWGDSSDPDQAILDPDVFAATIQLEAPSIGFCSSDTQQVQTSRTLWYVVGSEGQTSTQADVAPYIPIGGQELLPLFHAQCVR
jgi:hypothetical protein